MKNIGLLSGIASVFNIDLGSFFKVPKKQLHTYSNGRKNQTKGKRQKSLKSRANRRKAKCK